MAGLLKIPCHVRAILSLLAFAASLAAQALSPYTKPLPKVPVCNVYLLAHSENLSLRQRSCYYGERLISPSAILRTAFASGISQWRNSPYEAHQDTGDYAHRFAARYASRAAMNGSELLVGYLNHEDPRPRPSVADGGWNRTRSALLSVFVIKNEDGSRRPALSPVAGAFSSGFVGALCYKTNNTAEDGLRRTGISYSTYFMRAIYNEFHPDILAFASRLRHRKSALASSTPLPRSRE
jgi:hypothetical protein